MKQELVKQIEELLVKNYTAVREEAKAGKYAQLRDETEAAYKEYRKWSAAHGYASCEPMTTRCRQLKAYRDYLLAMMRKTDEEEVMRGRHVHGATILVYNCTLEKTM